MVMIEIKGFSKHQREIADTIWGFEDLTDVVSWFETLTRHELIEARVVYEMILCAVIDDEPLGAMKEANQIIDRIRHI
jgi:hypothetical protein